MVDSLIKKYWKSEGFKEFFQLLNMSYQEKEIKPQFYLVLFTVLQAV